MTSGLSPLPTRACSWRDACHSGMARPRIGRTFPAARCSLGEVRALATGAGTRNKSNVASKNIDAREPGACRVHTGDAIKDNGVASNESDSPVAAELGADGAADGLRCAPD